MVHCSRHIGAVHEHPHRQRDVRQPLDWAMIGARRRWCCSRPSSSACSPSASASSPPRPTRHDWEWISLVCGLICAGCVAYLLLEYSGPKAERVVLFAIAAGGIFGYLAVSNGVPAAMTAAYGKPGTEIFVMEQLTWGSRSCRGTVIARNERYSEMRICINYFGDRRRTSAARSRSAARSPPGA